MRVFVLQSRIAICSSSPASALFARLLILACALAALTGCPNSEQPSERVVIYVSVDQNHAEPILDKFEEQSGIDVQAVYDVEAAKTTGMVNRLIAEQDRPQADVFWSGEFAQTIMLKEQGVLQPYQPPAALALPEQLSDPENYWTGFSGRARVFIINTELVGLEDYPRHLDDLLDPKWPADKVAIALPLFGTTATHAAALYAAWGGPRAKGFFEQLKERGVRIEAGNSTVRDLVAAGTLMWGLTDTDDAAGAIARGSPVCVVFPGQAEDGMGTLVIPNTVALIEGARNQDQAKQLIDYLAGEQAERLMVETGWCHVPARETDVEPQYIDGRNVRRMDVRPADVYDNFSEAKEDLKRIFVN